MRRRPAAALFAMVCCLFAATSTSWAVAAEQRLALVIGNAAYAHAPALKNPVADAKRLSVLLRTLGFEVASHADLDGAGMRKAIKAYSDRLAAAGPNAISMIFFAGHGMQVRDNNYLLPVDADLRKESDAGLEAIHLADVLNTVFDASNKLNIIVLDACRDNPFRKRMRASSLGLSGFDAPVGTLVSYSTGPNKVAYDGDGENSPFVLALDDALQVSTFKVEEVFKSVSERVFTSTSRQQLPWFTSSVHGDFYLARDLPATAAVSKPVVVAAAPSPPRGQAPAVVAQAPTPPAGPSEAAATAISAELEGRIAFFIEWKFFGSDNGAKRLGPESYAEVLEFYYSKKSVPRAEVLKDKERYYARWPNRRFALDRKSIQAREVQPDVFDIVFDFKFDVENERRHSLGASTMGLKLKRRGNDFVILAQNEIIQERNATEKPPVSVPLGGAPVGKAATPQQ